MRMTVLITALMAVSASNAASAQDRYTFECKERSADQIKIFSRILGARTDVYPTKADYPWMVSLSRALPAGGEQSFCGGALISSDLVVTAAHCIEGSGSQVSFFVRQIAEDGSPRGDTRQVASIRKHEQFSESRARGIDYDIALIRLTEPFDIGRFDLPVIQSPRSQLSEFYGQPGDCVRVIGWGSTKWDEAAGRGAQTSDKLLAADIRVWNEASCAAAYPNATTMTEKLCAGYPEGKVDSCSGDSGGPLFATGGATGIRLLGVVSYGAGCGREGKPGVYARLSSLLDWMRETAQKM